MRTLFIALVIALVTVSCAQESPLLSFFTATDGPDAVRLDWEMIAGNTCYDIEIERSEDSTSFTTIGTIAGLCGHITEPTPYSFTDEDPPELSVLYYRVKLGLEGYSSVQRVEHLRLASTEIRLYPVPASTEVTLALRCDDRTDVELEVIDAGGRVVERRSGIRGPMHALHVEDWLAGVYAVRASWEGRSHVARLVVI